MFKIYCQDGMWHICSLEYVAEYVVSAACEWVSFETL